MLAPLALLQQWKDELEEKVEKDHVSVLIYHGAFAFRTLSTEQGRVTTDTCGASFPCTGPDRKSYKERHLRKYDFVLTTYSTLVHDVSCGSQI